METNILLKRLEVLKNVIALQDADDIEFQSAKLKKLIETSAPNELVEAINTIQQLIAVKAFGNAMELINILLNKYNAITKWDDPEVLGLRTEVIQLSAEIENIENAISEVNSTILSFEVKQIDILGDIILQILALKKKIAAKEIKENPHNINAENQYNEAEADEREYKGIYEEAKQNPVNQLPADEENELKNLFRKIVKLTHPDLVDNKFEKQAAELFDKAKGAKDKNDISTLKQILDYLINGKPFTLKQETITEKELLQKEVQHLRMAIQQLKQRLNDLQNSDTYKSIIAIADWDKHFMQTRYTLEAELATLKIKEK